MATQPKSWTKRRTRAIIIFLWHFIFGRFFDRAAFMHLHTHTHDVSPLRSVGHPTRGYTDNSCLGVVGPLQKKLNIRARNSGIHTHLLQRQLPWRYHWVRHWPPRPRSPSPFCPWRRRDPFRVWCFFFVGFDVKFSKNV